MHKFNLFENVINSLGKENRLCFQQASGPEATPLPLKATPDTAADLPEGATPDKAVPGAATKKTAEAGADPSAGLAAKKAEVAPPADDPYGEPAPNLSSESLLGDISADDKAAPAGDKDAPADAPAAPEKQPPKDYEFKDNVFTVTLPDDTKKATKIKVPEELKDKVTLILGGVTPASVDEHGAKCIHIKMGEITQWVVYEHKEDKFSVVGSDKLKSADGKAYEVSPLEDGNFEIKEATAETPKKYFQEGALSEGFKWVQEKENGKYYYIDKEGEKAFKGKEFDDAWLFSDGFAMVQEKKDGKYHYIDKEGEKAFKGKEFDAAWPFSDGFAMVKEGAKYYYIDTKGEKAFKGKEFDAAWPFSDGFAMVKEGAKYYYIDTKGEKAFGGKEFDGYREKNSEDQFKSEGIWYRVVKGKLEEVTATPAPADKVAPPADDPYGEPAPNLSSESLLGDISADDKAAPAGDKDAPADAPAAPEKQPPKDYEFKDNVFTVTLPDDTKKATKIKVPEELKDKVTLILGGVTPASVDEHGAKCIHIKMGEITQWVVYEHKEDKFSVVGSDKLKSADGKAYEVSPLEDGNFEIKKVTAEAAPEALDFTSKLDISKLQELLKTVKVEASPEDIKKAFLYYYKLDGSIKGDASQKTKEILNGTKALLTTQSLNKEQLSYLGSVDGTRYSLKKVEKQTPKWHQKKADALAKLLELNSAGRVLFIPEDKAPGEETKALIADYIAKVATATPEALNQAKALINDNQSVFLDAQGIFNIALAVERARDVKARILGDPNVELDTTDIIRIELGAKVKTLADRKSGLLLTENGKPVASFRDPNVKERVPKKKPYREGGYREGFKWVQEKKDGPYYFVKEIGGKAFNGRKFNSVGSFSEGLAYVQEKADGKWSFIDRSGKKAFGGKEFDDVWEFRKGFAPVQIGDKWYYLRRSGDKAFPNAFSEYRDQDGEHQLKSGTKWYHVTAAGTLEEAPLTAAAAEQAAAEQAATAKAAAAKAVLEKARETKAQPSYELDNGITLYTFSDNLSDGDYNPAELNSALSKIQAVTSKLSVEDQTLLKGTLKIYLLAEIKASWIERQGLAFETNQINIKYWAKAGELEEVIKGAIKLYKDQKEQEER